MQYTDFLIYKQETTEFWYINYQHFVCKVIKYQLFYIPTHIFAAGLTKIVI